jgi:hypothetical protein
MALTIISLSSSHAQSPAKHKPAEQCFAPDPGVELGWPGISLSSCGPPHFGLTNLRPVEVWVLFSSRFRESCTVEPSSGLMLNCTNASSGGWDHKRILGSRRSVSIASHGHRRLGFSLEGFIGDLLEALPGRMGKAIQ